jgi:hypothetical protein
MSHILEEYAKNLGVLISKPIVSKHYFPIPETKYITIYSEENIQSKNYKYFNLSLDLMAPILRERDIKVIQIDCRGEPLSGVNKVLGGLSFKQYASILSNSMLHIGIDNVYSHYASSQNIPLVNLFGNIYPSVTRGYWSKNHQAKNIAPAWDVKPCLNMHDPKSEINKIRPEQIAQSVLDLLKINKKINFKTIQIGELFNTSIIEVIPTCFEPINVEKNQLVFLRVDQGYNEEAFLKYCENYEVCIIADQLIQLHGLEKNRQNIRKISIFVDKDFGDIPERYFEILKLWNIDLQLMTKSEEYFPLLKNKYFDHSVNFYNSKKDKPQNVSNKNLFLSNKKVFEGGIQYPSLAHWRMKQKSVDRRANVLDTSEYWEDQDHFYIYDQN